MPYAQNQGLPSVGNKIIDSEHTKLIGMVNDIAQLIHLNHGVALSVALKLLDVGLREYFVMEENIASAVGFDFSYHRQSHQQLLKEIRSITDKIVRQNDKWSSVDRKNCISSLNDCLIRHIKVDSRPFVQVLETHAYDFRPGV